MESDRIKWNQRFASDDSYLGERPSPFLLREIDRIRQLAPGKLALDIACGEGRNSIFLAKNGFEVTAVDISEVGLAKAAKRAEKEAVFIDFQCVDLDGYQFTGMFDLIINFNFLLRDLIPQAVQVLSSGGLLIIDTLMESPQRLATSSSPAYFLRCGELHSISKDLPGEIILHEELPGDEQPTARILFRKTTITKADQVGGGLHDSVRRSQ